jgi:ribosomal protein S18 acetylase RimI-like enzyme
MNNAVFRISPYERKYAAAIRDLALEAWKFTYSKIFTPEEIEEYVSKFYSEENNVLAEELISQKVLWYSVAIDDQERLIGFQTSSISMLHAELTRIYIHPQSIGTGLGSALLDDSEKFFKENGFRSYQVKVHRYNTLGQKFYQRKGFALIGEDDRDHLLLKKDLH